MKLVSNVIILAFAFAVGENTHAQERTLYERLGGGEALTRAANELVENVSHDPLTRRSFEGVALKPLKAKVAEHLCVISSGPCTYSGENMAVAHTGLAITADEFRIMGAYLHTAFLRQGADPQALSELEAILESLRPDILNK
ncbi:group 1 truncated hemoglobin [Oxalobacteraceae bacterium OTU3CINTB1]|nr:group 1 truncated hemoglobin [Oxalobacteraceae bacterium OTU3CINTB1]